MLVVQALMCLMLAYDPWDTIPFWISTKIIRLQLLLTVDPWKEQKTGGSFTVLGLGYRSDLGRSTKGWNGIQCLRQTNQETHQASEWFRLSAPEKTPLPFGKWSRQLTQFSFVSPLFYLFLSTFISCFSCFWFLTCGIDCFLSPVFYCIWRGCDWLHSSVLLVRRVHGKDVL